MTARTIQIHFNTRNWLDQIGTPRYSNDQIDAALCIAISEYMDELLGEGKFSGTSSQEIDSATKNKLRYLILNYSALNGFAIDSLGRLSIPIAYIEEESKAIRKMIAIRIYTSSAIYDAIPATHGEIDSDFNKNSFDKPTLSYPPRVYFTIENDNIVFEPRNVFSISEEEGKQAVGKLTFSFVSQDFIASSGVILDKTFDGTVPPNTAAVYSRQAIYDGSPLKRNDKITDFTNFASKLTSGEVAYGYVDPKFPRFLEEELSKRTAMSLGLPTERMDKLKQIFA